MMKLALLLVLCLGHYHGLASGQSLTLDSPKDAEMDAMVDAIMERLGDVEDKIGKAEKEAAKDAQMDAEGPTLNDVASMMDSVLTRLNDVEERLQDPVFIHKTPTGAWSRWVITEGCREGSGVKSRRLDRTCRGGNGQCVGSATKFETCEVYDEEGEVYDSEDPWQPTGKWTPWKATEPCNGGRKLQREDRMCRGGNGACVGVSMKWVRCPGQHHFTPMGDEGDLLDSEDHGATGIWSSWVITADCRKGSGIKSRRLDRTCLRGSGQCLGSAEKFESCKVYDEEGELLDSADPQKEGTGRWSQWKVTEPCGGGRKSRRLDRKCSGGNGACNGVSEYWQLCQE